MWINDCESIQVITIGLTEANDIGQSYELKDNILKACATAFDVFKQ